MLAVFQASPARAQANYGSAPIGGRSTLMGRTGLVYGSDGAAAFMNPATVVGIDDQRLTFAVNFYQLSVASARHWFQPGPIDRERFGDLEVGDATITNTRLAALPSSLCLFLKLPAIHLLTRSMKHESARRARLGLCLATTAANAFSFAAVDYANAPAEGRETRQAQTITQTYSRLAFGPTYAMQISDDLAIGVSVHGILSSEQSLFAASATTYGGGQPPISSIFYSANHGDSFELNAIAGLTYRINRHQTVALAIQSPSVHLLGRGGANAYTQDDVGGAPSSTRMVSADGDFVSATPLGIGIGTGVMTQRGSVELNLNAFAPMNTAYRARLRGTAVQIDGTDARESTVSVDSSQHAAGVVNGAIGGELFLYPSVSLLGGLATDFSAVGSGDLHGGLFNYYPARSQRVSASFGVGSHGEGGDLLFGAEASYAWGQRLAVNVYQAPPSLGQAPHSTFAILFVIAGSTTLKVVARAFEDIGAAVTNPASLRARPPPAR